MLDAYDVPRLLAKHVFDRAKTAAKLKKRFGFELDATDVEEAVVFGVDAELARIPPRRGGGAPPTATRKGLVYRKLPTDGSFTIGGWGYTRPEGSCIPPQSGPAG